MLKRFLGDFCDCRSSESCPLYMVAWGLVEVRWRPLMDRGRVPSRHNPICLAKALMPLLAMLVLETLMQIDNLWFTVIQSWKKLNHHTANTDMKTMETSIKHYAWTHYFVITYVMGFNVRFKNFAPFVAVQRCSQFCCKILWISLQPWKSNGERFFPQIHETGIFLFCFKGVLKSFIR